MNAQYVHVPIQHSTLYTARRKQPLIKMKALPPRKDNQNTTIIFETV
jgi:hypothetical protein